ncbi:hypothetical protein RND81_12G208500 [Saponaria officinalis]|uniref:Retrovirus-related Pol polyprotein from transposon TNT 1-94-like beta-barrel domain-containing protein n=1 Tax=Saponaria officinalis TaxID=3572 RepID=A0AAW1HDD0_SAPOF
MFWKRGIWLQMGQGNSNSTKSHMRLYRVEGLWRSTLLKLQVVWDELDSMNVLPQITKVTTEIAEYLASRRKRENSFNFLMVGLDKDYGILRSNILLMDPLPSVDQAVSIMLQEETQTSNLGGARTHEASELLGKGETEKERCSHCGRDNHKSEMCWEIKGYHVGHPRHKKNMFKPNPRGVQAGAYRQQIPYQTNTRQQGYKRNASNVRAEQTDLSAAIRAATMQLENLLKLVPNTNSIKTRGESEEELECNFAGMMRQTSCINASNNWIIDSGATNHMTCKFETFENVQKVQRKLKISLPDGRYVLVTHRGDVSLENGIKLRDVLYVPEFKQNLLSVQKLAHDNQCFVTFFD